jgi:microcystin-dependent protein
LFSVLGNTFGGDGLRNFALPDFRGRIPIHPTPHLIYPDTDTRVVTGQQGGDEGTSFSFPVNRINVLPSSDATTHVLVPDDIENPGDTYEKTHFPPFQAVNFIICLDGDYPTRN